MDDLTDRFIKDPTAENVLEVAQYCRERGDNQMCYLFSHIAKEMKTNDTDSFVHDYNREISICAFYLGKKEEGLQACEDLIFAGKPELAINNEAFYLDSLSFEWTRELNESPAPDFRSTTPSIIEKDYGYLCVIRNVNYSIRSDGSYEIRHPEWNVITRNICLKMDPDLNVFDKYELIEKHSTPRFTSQFKGMEDLRLFGDEGLFLCTDLEFNREHFLPEICFGQYNEKGEVTKIIPLQGEQPGRQEKNWLPYIDAGGEIKIIYSFQPLIIYTIDRNGKQIRRGVQPSPVEGKDLSTFRGSAPPIPFEKGYLAIVHHSTYTTPRKYFCRFVWFISDWSQLKWSVPFYFYKEGIEFNTSICFHGDDKLLIGFSVDDNRAFLGQIDIEAVKRMLHL